MGRRSGDSMNDLLMSLYHGGVPGLKRGDLIVPGHDRKTVDGCPICEARSRGETLIDPPSGHPDRIYVTTVRDYEIGRAHV